MSDHCRAAASPILMPVINDSPVKCHREHTLHNTDIVWAELFRKFQLPVLYIDKLYLMQPQYLVYNHNRFSAKIWSNIDKSLSKSYYLCIIQLCCLKSTESPGCCDTHKNGIQIRRRFSILCRLPCIVVTFFHNSRLKINFCLNSALG